MQEILIHFDAGVTTLTINRVEKKNAFTAAMYAACADALEQARDDSAVRVLVVQGHPTVFSAGNDVQEFLTTPADRSNAPVFRFLKGLAAFPKPVIASVCGPAVGIGTTLLFHCDLEYAGDNAVFSMPFVNLGLCQEAGSSLLVPAMMGYHRAAEALLLGEPFMAEAALEVGLVNRIVPPMEANAVSDLLARKLASKPLGSLVETKRLLKKVHLPQVLERIDEEAQSFGRLLQAPAAQEALTAFMEKRKPDFSSVR